ncbi:MAG: tRNA guanosine(34) transglycosylase Tgt, partial [bacterium]|nr:tRNA guanosine(34) transglycosylase Tgt [bacterium]
MALNFTIENKDSKTSARAGVLDFGFCRVETPVFMPIGTQGSVKAMTPLEVEEMGYGLILGNTYHLYLRPGIEIIRKAGGLKKFINWPDAILTDSGGFQIFSLSSLRKLTDEGVYFSSHIDGTKHFLTPEKVIELQTGFGSDIMMALDECAPYPSSHEYIKKSIEITRQWAERCVQEWDRQKRTNSLFCIVQGGEYLDLREKSLNDLKQFDFSGFAMGGLSVGEPKEVMVNVLDKIMPQFPEEKPRYLMGVGVVEDIF